MKIYYIDSGPIHFFGTKKEALAGARSAARAGDTTVSVELCTIADGRQAIIDLANGITGRGELIATIGKNGREIATVGPAYDEGHE